MGGIFKAVTKIFDSILGGGEDRPMPEATPIPETPATLLTPTALPTSGDARVAKRKAGAQQLARKGRDSTILTDPDTLGAA